MNAKYLLAAGGLLLAGCAKSPEKDAEKAVNTYYLEMYRPPRQYKPISLKQVQPPTHSSNPVEGERWFSSSYAYTDSTGHTILSQDTVAVEANGKVLFWSSK